jgi:hypothetical protein
LLAARSVIIDQAIPEKLSIASYSAREMYTAAQRFMTEFSAHFQLAIEGLGNARPALERIICSAGNVHVDVKKLLDCLSRARFDHQGLNMAVERYICRCTPDYAGQPLPEQQGATLKKDIGRWASQLYGDGDAQSVVKMLTGKLDTISEVACLPS